MIKFIYFQHHDAVGMSCFAAPRSLPAPPSALCGIAERASAVRAGGPRGHFAGRAKARGDGAHRARWLTRRTRMHPRAESRGEAHPRPPACDCAH